MVVRWARTEGAPPDPPWLSSGERARLVALRDDADRQRFVAARALLRRVVGDVAGCAPAEVVLHQTCARCGGPHGRPVVGHGLEVSMTHAGGLVAVAVARSPVGIDLEPVPTAAEEDRLVTWVRSEAVLKATGHGLEVDPRLVDVGAAGEPPRLARWSGPGRTPRLRLRDLRPAPGYVAAVARLGIGPLRVDARPVSSG